MEVRKKIFALNANMKQLLPKATDLVRLFTSSIVLFSHLCYAGPTCKKMNDLNQTKVFKSTAFEPEEEELEEAHRARKRARQPAPKKSVHQSAVSSAGLSDSDSEIEVSAPSRFRGATQFRRRYARFLVAIRKLKKKVKKAAGKKTLGPQSDDVRITFCSLHF